MSAQRPAIDIFLCHNRLDRPFVREVAEGLELEFGIPHFLDEYAIPAGEEFLPWIKEALARSKGCAIFLGKNGWGPTHLREAKLALARYRGDPEFRLIPVVIGEVRPEDAARLGSGSIFSGINWVSLPAGNVDPEAVDKLCAAFTGEKRDGSRGPAQLTPYLLRRDAARWQKRRDSSLLYRGRELNEAEQLLAKAPELTATPEVGAFLAAAERAVSARSRRTAGIAVVASLVLAGLTILALYQSRVARSRELAALGSATDQLDRGLLLAEAAYQVSPTIEAKSALFRLLSRVRRAELFLHGHPPGVQSVALSPDGRFAAAGGEGGQILVWDLSAPGSPKSVLHSPAALPGRANEVHALAFAGTRQEILATYEWGGPLLWRLPSAEARPFQGWPAPTAGTRRVSTNWQGADPEPPESRGQRPVTALALDRGRRRAVLGDFGGRIFGVDLETASTLWKIQLDLYDVAALALVPGEETVVVADAGGRLREVDSRSLSFRPFSKQPHASRLALLEYLPAERRLLSLDSTGRLVWWKQQDRRFSVERSIFLPILPASAALDTKGRRILVAALGGDIRVFSLEFGSLTEQSLQGHRLAPQSIRCGETGSRCLSGGLGGEVVLWNLEHAHPLLEASHEIPDLLSDLQRRADDTVHLLALPDGGLAWSPAAAPAARRLFPFEELSGLGVQELGAASALAFPDGRVTLFREPDFGAPTPLGLADASLGPIDDLEISPQGRWIAGETRGRWLFLWRRETPATPAFQVQLPRRVSMLRFSPDENTLLVALVNGQLIRWDLRQIPPQPLYRRSAATRLASIVFSPDGKTIMTGGSSEDPRIRVWEASSLRLLKELPQRHTTGIGELEVAHKSPLLLSAGGDGDVVLWDTRTWREIGFLPHGVDTTFQAIALDGSEEHLITAASHRISIWKISDLDLLKAACTLANRVIASAEWQESVGGRQPKTGCAARASEAN